MPTRRGKSGTRGARAAAVAGVLLASGCAMTAEDFARDLRRGDVRTFVAEDDFTVLSPYPPQETSLYLMYGREAKQALEANLGVALDAPVIMVLEQRAAGDFTVVIENGTFAASGSYRTPTENGVAGLAFRERHGSHVIKLYVGPFQVGYHADGRRIDGVVGRPDQGLIVHELAHRYAEVLGLVGPSWFSEGFALYLEYCDIELLAMTPQPAPEILAPLRGSSGEWSLAALLDWQEDGSAVHEGTEDAWNLGRPLAYAWMRFLIETRVTEGSLGERFASIFSMEREEALALEASWREWLRRLLSEPSEGASGRPEASNHEPVPTGGIQHA